MTTWSFRIDLGKIDGKRKQIERSGSKNETEANKALATVLHDLNKNGEFFENKRITFQTIYDEFMEKKLQALDVLLLSQATSLYIETIS